MFCTGVLKNGDEEVRGYAAWALGKIGGGKAVQALTIRTEEEKECAIKDEIESALAANPIDFELQVTSCELQVLQYLTAKTQSTLRQIHLIGFLCVLSVSAVF